MGYRSGVVIAVANTVVQDVFVNAEPGDVKHYNEYTVFIWDDVKWYDDYEEVNNITTFLAELSGESYGFIRLGEDFEDVEYKGNTWDFDLSVTRKVNY